MAEPLRVRVEVVGVGDVGIWCPSCALSSGVVIWYATTTLGATTLRSMIVCNVCRRRDLTRDD